MVFGEETNGVACGREGVGHDGQRTCVRGEADDFGAGEVGTVFLALTPHQLFEYHV